MFETYEMPNASNTALLSETYIRLHMYINQIPARTVSHGKQGLCLPTTDFIDYFSNIEKLQLENSGITRLEYTSIPADYLDITYNSRFFTPISTGICIMKTSLSCDIDEGIKINNPKILEAASENIKQTPSHKIKIFTVENSNFLFVATNKNISYESFLKLDLLHWSLLKEKLPKYKKPLEDMIKALLAENITDYSKALERLFEDPAMVDLYYAPIINAFTSKREHDIDQCKIDIGNTRARIENLKNELSETLITIQKLNERLEFMETRNTTVDTDILVKYIKKNPYIKQAYTSGERTLILTYNAPLLYFDEYILEKVRDRKHSTRQKILDIFLQNKYELVTQCTISFDTFNFHISRAETMGNSANAMGHPHIDQFACFGNHALLLAETAENTDYLMALEEITQAVLNINFSDGVVINNMLDVLEYNIDRKWWRNKKTGEFFSTADLIN